MPRVDYTKQAWCRKCATSYDFEHLIPPHLVCPRGHHVRLKARNQKPASKNIDNFKRYWNPNYVERYLPTGFTQFHSWGCTP